MISRKTLTLLIVIPILYTILFGSLFSRNVLTEVPIIICNLDDGLKSQQIIKDLYDTPEIKIIAVDTSTTDFYNLIVLGHLAGVVVIPKNFSKILTSALQVQ